MDRGRWIERDDPWDGGRVPRLSDRLDVSTVDKCGGTIVIFYASEFENVDNLAGNGLVAQVLQKHLL
jgi:hypothetical protein